MRLIMMNNKVMDKVVKVELFILISMFLFIFIFVVAIIEDYYTNGVYGFLNFFLLNTTEVCIFIMGMMTSNLLNYDK